MTRLVVLFLALCVLTPLTARADTVLITGSALGPHLKSATLVQDGALRLPPATLAIITASNADRVYRGGTSVASSGLMSAMSRGKPLVVTKPESA